MLNIYNSNTNRVEEIKEEAFDSSVHFHINTRSMFSAEDIAVFEAMKPVETPKKKSKKVEEVVEEVVETPVEVVVEVVAEAPVETITE